jgi:prepilin-type N-terminal cleavage/methylation domain-containing protein
MRKGFTLMELLLVVSLLAVIIGGTASAINIKSKIQTGDDARRKDDLKLLGVALEHYNTDHGCYPTQSQWDGVSCNGTPDFFHSYIPIFPCDPETHTKYIYQSTDKNCQPCSGSCGQCGGYRLLTTLSIKTDSQIQSAGCDPTAGCGITAPSGQIPNYGISVGCTVTAVGFNAGDIGPIPSPTTRPIDLPTAAPSTVPPATPTPVPSATPPSVPTNTPTPIPTGFSNVSAALGHDQAAFSFAYNGTPISPYVIDISTLPNMASDVYLSFGSGYGSPVVTANPVTKWDKYSCGRTLYWRVTNNARSINSPIQTSVITCLTPSPTPTAGPVPSRTPLATAGPISKKVFLVVYNPHLSAAYGNKTVINYYGWNDPYALTNSAISWWSSQTQNRITFTVVKQTELNEFPVKQDGFTYNENSYYNVVRGITPSHNPDIINYNTMLTETNACALFNSGQIDELWMFGGPWFGFYESTLAGNNGFWYNSPPVTGSGCLNLMPIMGYSYERGYSEMIHDFGHRTEATMTEVYGSWSENAVSHNFDRFGLVKAQSPNFSYSGCGSTHYPPNATADYDYSDLNPMPSVCDDFNYYPNILDIYTIPTVAKNVSCSTWGCTDVGYYGYWFSHLPKFTGVGPDGKLNDWWYYLLNPNKAIP